MRAFGVLMVNVSYSLDDDDTVCRLCCLQYRATIN